MVPSDKPRCGEHLSIDGELGKVYTIALTMIRLHLDSMSDQVEARG
jgi:hypothetical protein